MALDLPLPKKVFGHPWFNSGNDKMSKSKGNVIYADELAEYFSVDGTRYYALAEMPYNSDGTITYENVITRYNNDLANNLGNLVSRTHAMTKKYFDGIVPTPGEETELDLDLKKTMLDAVVSAKELMASYHVADSLDALFSALRRANKYIDETTPWVLAKNEDDKPRLATVIYNLLETVRIAAVVLTPYLPSTAEKIFGQLGTDMKDYSTVASFGALKSGEALGEAFTLFARVDEKKFFETIEAKRAAEEKAAEEEKCDAPAVEPEIAFDEFTKVDLRVAEVLECEPVPKSKKLLKLQVDLGFEKRQVVSGIAKFYTPDELVGKKVVLVANLKPAKLFGIDSYGMILASGEEDVKVVFLDPSAKNGDRIH
jgi:methionyl-tRNA synthetase